jgi:hypothetical protein
MLNGKSLKELASALGLTIAQAATPQVTPQVKKVLTVRKFESVQIEPNFFERPRPTGSNGHEVALTLDIFRRKLVR